MEVGSERTCNRLPCSRLCRLKKTGPRTGRKGECRAPASACVTKFCLRSLGFPVFRPFRAISILGDTAGHLKTVWTFKLHSFYLSSSNHDHLCVSSPLASLTSSSSLSRLLSSLSRRLSPLSRRLSSLFRLTSSPCRLAFGFRRCVPCLRHCPACLRRCPARVRRRPACLRRSAFAAPPAFDAVPPAFVAVPPVFVVIPSAFTDPPSLIRLR